MDDVAERIEKLQGLRDRKLITEQEFEVKRQALLDQFVGLHTTPTPAQPTPLPARRPVPAQPLRPRRPPVVFSTYAAPRLQPVMRGFSVPGHPRGAFSTQPPMRIKPYQRMGPALPKQVLADAGTTIKVQPVPEGLDETQLVEAFSEYGEISSAAVHRGNPPYAHVNFTTRQAASTVAMMDKFDWGGLICRVTLSRRRWEAVLEGAPTNGIGIFHLPLTMTQEELQSMLAAYPGLIGVKMVHHKLTPDGRGGDFRGFAFAYFDTIDNASLAKAQLLGVVLEGNVLDVKFSNKPIEEVLGRV